ncbi:4Fe-4S dicluster domain-containing protein [Halobacteriovorax sp. HLS]|uniref:4Fe-4S dicluster domain-containing protein n=1 Tax=Halobacteriovorax sp. HLS TaxID=2234000 RepID=UPI000FD9B5FF|nr:4Fe-4S dicluster domain-containing protein [Halobacteriovorax sp. HLS]
MSDDKKSDNRIEHIFTNALNKKIKRRSFITTALGTSAITVAPVKSVNAFSFEKFFQKHYKELTPKQKEKAFKRIAKETKAKYGVDVNVGDHLPLDGVKYAYCLNLSTCNGSRKCVTACAEENNIPKEIGSYIRVLEMPIGTMNPEKGSLFYEGESVPKDGKYYLPVQCNHCDNSPCTKVCPVEATWKEKDGIVVVDYDWCIGCRYCQTACPYEARHFNFKEPTIDRAKINTEQSYLSNRIRPKGVMEKCTFCLHRSRSGQYPACLEACPTGARKFGNILDPESEVNQIFKNKRVFVLKEELNTLPQFFYYFD